MSEQTTTDAERKQDITAEELIEKFGLTAEQAASLAAALPELLKQFMAEQKTMSMPTAIPQTQDELGPAMNDLADSLIMVYQHPELMDRLGRTIADKLTPPPQLRTDSKPRIIVTDSIMMDVQTDSIKLEDGILSADCIATAAMVQDYDGKQVLKDPEELRKAAGFARELPITDGHPHDGIVTSQDEVKGWTTPLTYDETKKRLGCSVKITDGTLIKKVQDGKKDVSIGFFCDVEEKTGEYEGKKYTAVQRNIVLNHLAAGIDSGRCPTGKCGIGQDTATKPPTPEAQRAIKHFELTQEYWDKLTEEEQREYIRKLPNIETEPEKQPEAETKKAAESIPKDEATTEPPAEKAADPPATETKKEEEPKKPEDEIDWEFYKGKPCVGEGHYDWLMQADKDAKLTPEQRKELPDTAFCGPGKSFPVPDCAHYTAALRMLGRYEGPGNKDTILACIKKKGDELSCGKDKAPAAPAEPPAANPTETESETPEDKCKPKKEKEELTKKKDSAYKDDELLSLVDSIMDFNPPHKREHYLSKTKQDLKDLLVLLRAKADTKAPPQNSSSKPANKDQAYGRLVENWNKR